MRDKLISIVLGTMSDEQVFRNFRRAYGRKKHRLAHIYGAEMTERMISLARLER